jgi:hypothetical protein
MVKNTKNNLFDKISIKKEVLPRALPQQAMLQSSKELRTTPVKISYALPAFENAKKKASCEASGGVWDEATQTCTQADTEAKVTKTEAIRNQETGRVTGVELPDGRFLGGLKPKDVQLLLEKQRQRTELPQGTVAGGTAQAQADMIQQLQNAQGISPDGREIIQPQGAVSNIATGASAAAGAVIGAKSGAGIGTLIAPGIGTAIGGIIGGIGGAIGGAYVKQRFQKNQDINEANKVFTQAKQNKAEIMNMINSGIITEGQARGLWAEEKQNIFAVQRYLQQQTQSDLNNFLGNPGDDLIAVDSYLTLDPFYDLEFEKALIMPNPTRILNLPNETEE